MEKINLEMIQKEDEPEVVVAPIASLKIVADGDPYSHLGTVIAQA